MFYIVMGPKPHRCLFVVVVAVLAVSRIANQFIMEREEIPKVEIPSVLSAWAGIYGYLVEGSCESLHALHNSSVLQAAASPKPH